MTQGPAGAEVRGRGQGDPCAPRAAARSAPGGVCPARGSALPRAAAHDLTRVGEAGRGGAGQAASPRGCGGRLGLPEEKGAARLTGAAAGPRAGVRGTPLLPAPHLKRGESFRHSSKSTVIFILLFVLLSGGRGWGSLRSRCCHARRGPAR